MSNKMNTTDITTIVINQAECWYDYSSSDVDDVIPADADGVRDELIEVAENNFDDNTGDEWLMFCAIMMAEKVRNKIDWTKVRNETIKRFADRENAVPVIITKPLTLEQRVKNYLNNRPGSTAREILKELKKATPEMTKTEINSLLYKMKGKVFNCNTDPAPGWFVL